MRRPSRSFPKIRGVIYHVFEFRFYMIADGIKQILFGRPCRRDWTASSRSSLKLASLVLLKLQKRGKGIGMIFPNTEAFPCPTHKSIRRAWLGVGFLALSLGSSASAQAPVWLSITSEDQILVELAP